MDLERKFLFDEVVADYAEARPGYPPELLNDIIRMTGIDKDSKILEIGCGTGQATQLFIENGFDVTAVELGKKLAAYTQNRFKDYKRFKVINLPFEEFRSEEKYKLIFAASAFHWIDPQQGFPLIHSLLEKDGWLALFWNSKAEKEQTGELAKAINGIYDQYYTDPDQVKLSHAEREKQIRECGLFGEVIAKLYPYTRIYTSGQYVQLLKTYSDHIAQPADTKQILYAKIQEAIDLQGGTITVPYEVKAYFAGKKDLTTE